MKKLLFVTSALGYGVGGSEKALIEMLKRLDTEKYSITVLSLNEKTEKPFESDVVRAVYGYDSFLFACTPMREIVKAPWKYSLRFSLMKLKVALFTRFTKKKDTSGTLWNWYSRYIDPIPDKYDIVIGYGPGVATYFAVDKVKADRTVLWVDTDLRGAHFDTEYFRRFYEKADKVITVDQSGIDRFSAIYPDYREKTLTIRNIIPVDEIKEKAENGIGFEDDFSGFRILSVGRLCEAKAFHLAVGAAAILRDRGFDFKWYIIGFGDLEKPLREQIISLGLQERFILLGQKLNPYPFYRQTDIYVQTSVYEGSPLTIEEAMVFGKPIVTTAIPAAFEIIWEGKNGVITQMTPESIADGIEKLLRKKELIQDISEYTKTHPLDYQKPIVDFDSMISTLQ